MSSQNRFKLSNFSMELPSVLGLGLVFGLSITGILAYAARNSDNNKDKSAYTINVAKTDNNLASIVNSNDNNFISTEGNSAYIVNSSNLVQLANSDTNSDTTKVKKASPITKPSSYKKPTIYGGVEVNDLQKFSNAKLIGVDQMYIEYDCGSSTCTFFTKGLLFELNNAKLLNIVAPNYPFYVGQRYDISYHTFKKGVIIDSWNVVSMYLSSDERIKTTQSTDYAKRFDGAIVEFELSRKAK